MKEIYLCLEEFDEDGDSFDPMYTTSPTRVVSRLQYGDIIFRLSDMKQITAAEINLIIGE